jgi:4-carboxymuconolactone decarboxylase
VNVVPQRVALLERDDVGPEHVARYEAVAAARGGRVANVFKALANSPLAMERVAGVGAYLRFEAGLPTDLRELVTLTVAQQAGCSFEWTAHWNLAIRDGVDVELLRQVGTPAIEQLASPLGPALTFARLVADGREVPDAIINVIRHDLGDRGLVDLTVLVAYYTGLARIINTLGVPLEAGTEAHPFNT